MSRCNGALRTAGRTVGTHLSGTLPYKKRKEKKKKCKKQKEKKKKRQGMPEGLGGFRLWLRRIG